MDSASFELAPYRNVTGFTPDDATVPILVSTLAVAVAAFCVWLTVRIVNRRETWAKWTLAVTLSLPVLYVLSFGPACWIFSKLDHPLWMEATLDSVFDPLAHLLEASPEWVSAAFFVYSDWWFPGP